VLALQALEPLLLLSADATRQHGGCIATILSSAAGNAAAGTPAAPHPLLLLQAVASAGAVVAARPAQGAPLVTLLEQLMLAALAAADGPAADEPLPGEHDASDDGAAGSRQGLAATAASTTAAGVAAAAEAAAGWYCRLLVQGKLLLTGTSWGIVAAGLTGAGQQQVRLCAVKVWMWHSCGARPLDHAHCAGLSPRARSRHMRCLCCLHTHTHRSWASRL
jgi:hypothetical protein